MELSNRILTAAICALLLSCSGNDLNIRVTTFPSTKKYAMSEVENSNVLLMPSSLFTSGKYLVITQRRADPLFYFFSSDDCTVRFSAGTTGKAANEFNMPDPRFYVSSNTGFTVLDAPNILKTIEIKDTGIVIKSSAPIPVTGVTNNLLILNSSTYCYSNNDPSKDYQLIIDKTDGSKEYVSPYPDWVKTDSNQKQFTYLSNNVSNPITGRFAACYAYFRKIRIFDINGKMIKDISVETPDTPDFQMDNKHIAYGSIPFATDKYIYALCQNRRRKDELNPVTEIHVFDWNGKPQAKWIFDKPFDIFTLSADGKNLFGINSQDGSKIYKCSL